jgi:sugar lactone lactonase YvrE
MVDASGVITTVAGTGVCGFSGDLLPATESQLTLPRGISFDGEGNLYIADAGSPISAAPGNCRIRRVNATDQVMVSIAGNGRCDYGGDGGPATQAALKNAKGVVIDSTGAVFIADYDNCRIRKVNGTTISTFAGESCDDVDPFGIAIDSDDNIYIADAGNSRVQRLTPDGQLTVLAGPPEILNAEGVAVDANGDLYIADTHHCTIKKIANPAGDPAPASISVVAGNGSCGYSGEGEALQVALNYPSGLTVDASGNIYVADTVNCRVRKIVGAAVSTVAGNGACHTVTPSGLAVDADGNVFVSDKNGLDCHVLRIAPAGDVTRVAGVATIGTGDARIPCDFSGDGPAADAALNEPADLAVDGAGTLYIADTRNCRIRAVTAATLTTVAGEGSCTYAGDGGPAIEANLNWPQAVAIDEQGAIYIADTENCVLRKVAAGTIATLAGTAECTFGGDGGPASQAQLNWPSGLALDAAGNIFIADTLNCRIRRIDAANGVMTTVAGNGECGYGGDGGPATSALLDHPSDVAVDTLGQLVIADTGNCRIRQVRPEGRLIFTLAGTGDCGYSGDGGPAVDAAFNEPSRVSIAPDGAVYVADTANGRVRVITVPDRDGDGNTDVEELRAGSDPDPTSIAPDPASTGDDDDDARSMAMWWIVALVAAMVVAAAAAAYFWRRQRRP